MVRTYEFVQLSFAAFVLGLIVERARAILSKAPTSERAMKWLGDELRQGNKDGALSWARRVPESFAAQMVLAGLAPVEPDHSPALTQVELRHRAVARLGVLRGCATLASALGLLGGILAIGQGFGGAAGLLALKAGHAEQVALAQALESMAIGVGTSALCFYALGIFRQAARGLVAQSTQVAHLLSEFAAEERLRVLGAGRG